MLRDVFQDGDDARETDDFRSRPDDGHDLDLGHNHLLGRGSENRSSFLGALPLSPFTCTKSVSGRCGSKLSLAQNKVIISPPPMFSIESVYSGGMSTARLARSRSGY